MYYFQIDKEIEGCERYKGWYILIYVDKIGKKDWKVRGIYDEVPEVYLLIQENEPQDVLELNTANLVCLLSDKIWGGQYRAQLIESNQRERPQNLTFLGKYNSFSRPHSNFPMVGSFGWRMAERDILWAYKLQLKMHSEE